MRNSTDLAVIVVSAAARNHDAVWSLCDLQSCWAIALKLEWTPIQLNSSNPIIQSHIFIYENQLDA
jgi:hypothetical protein